MKQTDRQLLVLTGLVAGLVLLFGPTPGLAVNLLGDPSFELSTNPGGFPNSGFWIDDHIGEAGAVLDLVTPRTGVYSMHVYTGASGPHYLSRPRQVDRPAIPGRSYHAGGYLATRSGHGWQSGSAAYFRVAFLNGSAVELAHFESPSYQAASSTWTLFELTTTSAPAGTTSVRFTLYLTKPDGLAGQSIVNVDDCFLEEVELPPALAVAPLLLPFGATNDSLILQITNTGGGSLGWSVSPDAASWLMVTPPTSGSTLPGEPDLIEVRINRDGLPEGEYTSLVTVTPSSGPPVQLPVEMLVAPVAPSLPAIVALQGRRLMVQSRRPDGSLDAAAPYRLRGFAYSPAGVATTAAYSSRRQAIQDWHPTDFGLLRAAAANTIYVFLDFGLTPAEYLPILDSAYRNGLMVVLTVDEDGNYNLARAEAVVAAYKNHPAVLMWAIGNEWNINLYHGQFTTLQAAAQATESLAQAIHSWDPNHPVAAIYGDISIAGQDPDTATIVGSLCPSVDVWGLNIYRGQRFYQLFDQWAAISAKPFFISEFGIDSLHTTVYFPNPISGYQDETEQATWNHFLWSDLRNELSAVDPAHGALGGTVFSWVDEWWKVQPAAQQDSGGFYTEWNPAAFPDSFANEEHFGSLRIDNDLRIPKIAYYRIRQDFLDDVALLLFADGFESGTTAAWN